MCWMLIEDNTRLHRELESLQAHTMPNESITNLQPRPPPIEQQRTNDEDRNKIVGGEDASESSTNKILHKSIWLGMIELSPCYDHMQHGFYLYARLLTVVFMSCYNNNKWDVLDEFDEVKDLFLVL